MAIATPAQDKNDKSIPRQPATAVRCAIVVLFRVVLILFNFSAFLLLGF
jgi:hypothetical protein